ncbi:MAG: hypothetical protein IIA59_00640 [Candidatus Marinimicrobia bacterium]|nr:hypothetical protein [Candidatus Neomarinimicrobiota bacterium]
MSACRRKEIVGDATLYLGVGLMVLLVFIGCVKSPVESARQPLVVIDTVLVAVDSHFRAMFTQRWTDPDFVDGTAKIQGWVTVGYFGPGTRNVLFFESTVFHPDLMDNVGEVLEIMLTEIPAPGGSWDNKEVVWNFNHISTKRFDVTINARYAVLHRIFEVSAQGSVVVAISPIAVIVRDLKQ